MSKLITCPNCKSVFDITVEAKDNDESNYLWILDNGHGGMIDGVYQTPGKRSPVWPDGTQLFEGEFNIVGPTPIHFFNWGNSHFKKTYFNTYPFK